MDDHAGRLDQFTLSEKLRRQMEETGRESQEAQERLLLERQAALQQDPQNAELYIRLAKLHKVRKEDAAGLDVLREGVQRCAPSLELFRVYSSTLKALNRTKEAIAVVEQALGAFPDDFSLKLRQALLLPILYESPGEIEEYRQRYAAGLAALNAEVALDTPEACRQALAGLLRYGDTNFYLAYQGGNDVDLQRAYGQLVQRIVAANFPACVQPVAMPPLDGKLRIGYVSSHLRKHVVAKMYLRWLSEHDRNHFEVSAYHLGTATDTVTEEFRRGCTRFHHVPTTLADAAQAILSDHLHVLVFLDIGMTPTMTLLGAMRLAPIQCVGWGHPVTTGLTTIDYFLSSALMEPANGQEHYSEQLICLPGVGVCYEKTVIPRALLSKRRRDYGLRENAVIYLSCQSSYKYLPQHDDVYPAIAKRVPSAQFVFLTLNDGVRSAFKARLERAFSAMGLVADDYCVLLLQQPPFDYWNLNLRADVFLDTLDWSGGLTTLEAIACGLPIVTLPGQFMRGRHSYGILTQFGVTETIARDKADYVDIAVRLGEDPGWRAALVQRLKDGSQRFYADTSSLTALEGFYKRVVQRPSGNR